jgi:hypothetical protein
MDPMRLRLLILPAIAALSLTAAGGSSGDPIPVSAALAPADFEVHYGQRKNLEAIHLRPDRHYPLGGAL